MVDLEADGNARQGVDVLVRADACDEGVEEIVYLGYYETTWGLLGATNLEEAVDYGDAVLDDACANTTASCVFIDPRSSIRSSDITLDGVHPTASGSAKLADRIWVELEPLL